MPDDLGPERSLAAAGRPRPLPTELRERLEEALLLGMAQGDEPGAAVTGSALPGGVMPSSAGRPAQAPKPLPGAARGRLEASLSSAGERSPRARWAVWLPGVVAVAAVLAVVLAFGVPNLGGRPSPGNVAAARAKTLHAAARQLYAAQQRPSPTNDGKPAPPKAAPGKAAFSATKIKAGTTKTSRSRQAPSWTPPVLSVSPDHGPAAGGNWVTVRGEHLASGLVVRFGREAASRVRRVSATELRVLVPAHAGGPVTVTVTLHGSQVQTVNGGAFAGASTEPPVVARYRFMAPP